MGEAAQPTPVKLILGVIAAGRERLGTVQSLLEPEFGPVDLTSDPIRFDFTEFYRNEMGDDLWRQFQSFRNLVSPEKLCRIKILTNRLELETGINDSGARNRRLNLDPGYLTLDQIVLATTRAVRHRIYLDNGIYGNLELYYEKGEFKWWPWTYPDYRLQSTLDFFNRVRSTYQEQIKSGDGT